MNNINYTFIIPHKNSPELLKRCLDSIPERHDIQIIIIDDNSSSEFVSFDDFPGVKRTNTNVIFSKEGKGAGHARNIGLKNVLGKWILFADADDYYAPDLIDILDKELNENLDILYFDIFSNDHNFNRAKIINEYYNQYKRTQDISIIKYKIWAPWNKVFSSQFIKQHKISFDEIPVGNDAMFALFASLYANNIKVITNQLYCLTFQANSITYRPMTFERELAYAEINSRINSFFINNQLYKFQFEIFTPKRLFDIWRKYGLKKLIKYMKVISKKYSINRAIIVLMKRKFI